jgi:prevent-host-death family protein
VDRSENSPTSNLRVADDIVPVGELKAHLSEMIRALRGRRRPLVVTQNGKPAAVILSPEDFDRLTGQARFVASVHEGLSDLEAGRVMADDDLGRRLDTRFGALSKSKKKR